MKNLVFIFIIFIGFSSKAQKERSAFVREPHGNVSSKAGTFIDINTANYPESAFNVTDLIKKVLINGGACIDNNITNVHIYPDLPPSSTSRSYGYYNKTSSTFPFNEGIILSTGFAQKAGNTINPSVLSDNIGTSGDQDLATAIGVSNPQLRNATYIEFDFVAVSNSLKFDYLFASEEYTGTFPCSYTDGFALLIKRVGDPNYTNLAVLPNGLGPVSVTNIRPQISASCIAQNANYFAGYNTPSVNTNFNGSVIPLTASATLIPGETYRFKIVLADFSDNSYDSAVFIKAGSFNFGLVVADSNSQPLPTEVNLCNSPGFVMNVQIQTTSTASYSWYYNGVLINGANSNSYTAIASGDYKVSVVIDGNACPIEKTITINNNQGPTVTNSTLSKCSVNTSETWNLNEANASLSATPGVSYAYYTTLAAAQAGGTNNIANPTAYASGSTTLYVLIKTASCSKIAELQLQLTTNPSPQLSSPTNILCAGSSIVLSSSSATNNVWSTGATTQSITVNTVGTYTLKTVNGSCESAIATIDIINDPNPLTVQITGSNSFCQGASTTLTSSFVGTNVWSTGATTQSITVNTPGNYTVSSTNANGCSYSKTITVTQEASIVAAIQAPTTITCSTNQVTLDASGSTYLPGNTMQWVASNGGTIESGGNSLSPVVSSAGTYTLTITGANCSDSKQVIVLEDKLAPNVTIASDRMVICAGESVTLNAGGAANYQWGTGGATPSNSLVVSPSATTTYSVTGIGSNGCTTLKTIEIQVVPAIVSSISNAQVCNGDVITLDAGSGPNYTYLWDDNSTGATRAINAVGSYTVTINNGVCSKQFTAVVAQAALPEITEVNYQPNSLTILANSPSNGMLEYSIDGLVWQNSNVFTGLENNTTYPTMVRVKGTSCLMSNEYFTFYMPNVITPNGDGYNERIDFTKVGAASKNFKGDIFDRYGKRVYQFSNSSKMWDGKQDGRNLPSETYWYYLQWEDNVTKKIINKTGWILLKNRN